MLFHSSIRKELARSFVATMIVLVTVVMTMTLIRTLGMASRGSFNPSDVMLVMGYTVLTFMPNIMTMGLFIATIATLSRMYRDSEMVIWFSSGVELSSLLRPLLRFVWPILVVIAALALFALPWANQQIEDMKSRYENRGDLERVQPGQFQESAGGKRVFFVEKNQLNQQSATNIFMATSENDKETITSARKGHTEFIGNDRFLILENGQRLENTIGKTDLKISEFDRYAIRVAQDALGPQVEAPLSTRTFLELAKNPTHAHLGEISWRVGFVLAALNLMILALTASRVNPRVGRSGNFIFALLLFQVYLNLLSLGQTWIASGQISFTIFNLLLHGGVMTFAMLWLTQQNHNWHMGRSLLKLMRGNKRASL